MQRIWTDSMLLRTFSLLKKKLMSVFVVTIADMNTRKWNFLLQDYPKLSE